MSGLRATRPSFTVTPGSRDTAYRSAENERYLEGIGRVSRIHRRKPAGRPMARHIARGNATKSAIRAHVEHPFACQKGVMGLVIRTIGIARATAKIGLENLAYNISRFAFLMRKPRQHAGGALPA